MSEFHLSPDSALHKLKAQNEAFITLFKHGSLSVEVYKPDQIDRQQPHDRDEIYVVISGSGQFFNDGITTDFKAGDFLFVAAGKEHRFLNFTSDFATWVFFYGPIGGEAKQLNGQKNFSTTEHPIGGRVLVLKQTAKVPSYYFITKTKEDHVTLCVNFFHRGNYCRSIRIWWDCSWSRIHC